MAKKNARPCDSCGTIFYPRTQQLKKGGGRFCSHKCKGAAFTGAANHQFGKPLSAEAKRKRHETMMSSGGYPSGPSAPHWKGGKTTCMGYVQIGNTVTGRVLEHRAVMEAHIGRKLRPDEVVHHINGNKRDNRIENLRVMTRAEHLLEHKNEIFANRIKVA
jgi:hypothetical protein